MTDHRITRRGLGFAAAGAAMVPGLAAAQAPQFFRIGTGSAGGTYYPIGGIIANAISCPPGAPCNTAGATDGVPGMVAVAVATQGSVQNVNLIQSGNAESGFTQSDVAHWAFTGTGLFEGRPKLERLRFVAHLFPEHIHAVVRRDSAIRSFGDLQGKRIAIGLQASGARIGSEMILEANGLARRPRIHRGIPEPGAGHGAHAGSWPGRDLHRRRLPRRRLHRILQPRRLPHPADRRRRGAEGDRARAVLRHRHHPAHRL
jgi:hypothetical protein